MPNSWQAFQSSGRRDADAIGDPKEEASMTAEIIALPVVWVDRSVKDDGSGNGARPIIAGFYRGDYEQTDRYLAALCLKGFRIVPLDGNR
jgi:hypothetical protein